MNISSLVIKYDFNVDFTQQRISKVFEKEYKSVLLPNHQLACYEYKQNKGISFIDIKTGKIENTILDGLEVYYMKLLSDKFLFVHTSDLHLKIIDVQNKKIIADDEDNSIDLTEFITDSIIYKDIMIFSIKDEIVFWYYTRSNFFRYYRGDNRRARSFLIKGNKLLYISTEISDVPILAQPFLSILDINTYDYLEYNLQQNQREVDERYDSIKIYNMQGNDFIVVEKSKIIQFSLEDELSVDDDIFILNSSNSMIDDGIFVLSNNVTSEYSSLLTYPQLSKIMKDTHPGNYALSLVMHLDIPLRGFKIIDYNFDGLVINAKSLLKDTLLLVFDKCYKVIDIRDESKVLIRYNNEHFLQDVYVSKNNIVITDIDGNLIVLGEN